ncbi:hypothetical protein [Catenuloplanes indicus]|uniref:Uncharacterized protein n=1 Tax=Catenuloplanes indicus TaxID=137267 RepID=A0AAE3W4B2_9ACTN|nr:hypothetical protein [Catenuloplanes indicus]MDQ0368632.1 hypothetical protein [Catenuloplanes indicus]
MIDDDIDLVRPLRVFRSRPALGVPFWRWECRACGDSGGGGSHPDAVGRALTHCVEHPSHPSSLVPPVNCRQENPRAPLRTIYEWLVARSALEPADADQLPLLVDDPAEGTAAPGGGTDDELASLGPVDVEWISAGDPVPAADLAALAWLAGDHAVSAGELEPLPGGLAPSVGDHAAPGDGLAPPTGDPAPADGDGVLSTGVPAASGGDSVLPTRDPVASGGDRVLSAGDLASSGGDRALLTGDLASGKGAAQPGGDGRPAADDPAGAGESDGALVQRRLADGWARALPTGWPPRELTEGCGPVIVRTAAGIDAGEAGSAAAEAAGCGVSSVHGQSAGGRGSAGYREFSENRESAVDRESAGGPESSENGEPDGDGESAGGRESAENIESGGNGAFTGSPESADDPESAADSDLSDVAAAGFGFGDEEALSASQSLPPANGLDGGAGLLEATEIGSAGDRIAVREPVSGPMLPSRRFLLPTAGLLPIVPPAAEAAGPGVASTDQAAEEAIVQDELPGLDGRVTG